MRRRGAHYSPPRKHDTPSSKPDRRDNHNGHRRHPAKHQERTSNGALRTSNNHSVNSLKSKIRDLTRSLNHNQDLPAGVRIEKERALAGYKQDLVNAEQEKQKQALITRYHRVRFFERQKATRNVKKATKRLENSEPGTPEHAAAHNDLHVAEVDLNYTQFYPLEQKYEGIYSRGANDPSDNPIMEAKERGDRGDTEKIPTSRPDMWTIVEVCMRNGSLEALRNGKLTTTLITRSEKQAATRAHARGLGGGVMINFGSPPKPTKARPSPDQDSMDESDGGFFEK